MGKKHLVICDRCDMRANLNAEFRDYYGGPTLPKNWVEVDDESIGSADYDPKLHRLTLCPRCFELAERLRAKHEKSYREIFRLFLHEGRAVRTRG